MSNFWTWCQELGVVIVSAIAFSGNSAVAQISQDGTLPVNSQINQQSQTITIIEGGTLSQNGRNLFHSFKDFSIPNGTTVQFNNIESVQNIISRVTGKSVSNIEGTIKAQHTANLFLINPNGIIFGPNASLQIGGSFVASTASSLNFDDGTKFSATDPKTTSLLKVNVPVGLQFGVTVAPISNQSQASSSDGTTTNVLGEPVGLQVKPGKTLALVGGGIKLEGGNLTAESGRIELGSVAGNSLVKLNLTNQTWILGYENVRSFQDIQINQRTVNGVKFSSQVDTSGDAGGSIHLQGKTVALSGYLARLLSLTTGDGDGKGINITTDNLILEDSAQVITSTLSNGKGGNLTVNASKSVDLIGGYTLPSVYTGLFSQTFADGNAGNIRINTGRLRIQNGAQVLAGSGFLEANSQLLPATGDGGNVTVNASKSVELIGTSPIDNPSSLSARTLEYGNGGKVNITTDQLIVRDGAELTVNVNVPQNVIPLGDTSKLGTPGALEITANSILLDNKGKLSAETDLGQGGDVTLNVQDLLLMRRNSQISTNAGTARAGGDGGNISINAPNGFIVAAPLENSDITANAFSGSGGKVTINAKSIFGFTPRTRADLVRLLQTEDSTKLDSSQLQTNDITAFSQENTSLSGTIQINSPDVDPSKGLVELPVNLVDVSQQIAASCDSGEKIAKGSFIATGRGGIASNPIEPLTADAVLADWITLEPEQESRAESIQNRVIIQEQQNTEEDAQKVSLVNKYSEIVEAQGWVVDANGNVVLVAQAPTVTPHSSALNVASCAVR
jgi:filamentous hemagglutinin family protein